MQLTLAAKRAFFTVWSSSRSSVAPSLRSGRRVVEGDHDIRDMLREQHTSADASCGLRMAQIDAVVVDVALPAMNGWGFLEVVAIVDDVCAPHA
jgi:hypothetical protein